MPKRQTTTDELFCKRWIFTVKKAVIKVSEPISLRRMFYSMQESGQILLFVKQRGASPILLSQTAGKTKVQIAGINRRQGGAALPVRVVAVFLAASELHVIRLGAPSVLCGFDQYISGRKDR